jgi:hypothetical protein
MSKNSSIGSPAPTSHAAKPPSSAPAMPSRIVRRIPKSSAPGYRAFAMIPATAPIAIQPMIPIL